MAEEQSARTGAPTPWPLALSLVAASLLLALAGAELALRLAAGADWGRPSRAVGIELVGGAFPATHDPELGHVPTPSYRGSDNPWQLPVAITEQGVRSNGGRTPPPGRGVLAVGDSFTFGDEVGDADTWPAQLEARIGRPVVNGGVFGYGLDQIVLRAERLVTRFDVDTLVLGLIFDDIVRTEFAYRYAWKPWFEVSDGELVLKGTPVPEPGSGAASQSALRKLLERSFVADRLLRWLDPEAWLLPSSIRVHDEGQQVSRLLIDRLAALARAHDLRVLVVLQWVSGQSSQPAYAAYERAQAAGLAVLDAEPRLRERITSGADALEDLFHVKRLPNGHLFIGHMTAKGNGLIAGWVAEWLDGAGAS